MSDKRKVLVNADALDELLRRYFPAGFQTNALGVTYALDSDGVMRLTAGGPDA